MAAPTIQDIFGFYQGDPDAIENIRRSRKKRKLPKKRTLPAPRGFEPLPYEPAADLPPLPSARGKNKPKKRPGGKWIWVPDEPISEEIHPYEPSTIPAWLRPPRQQPYNLRY
tara:strand:- start:609 stop:944 length:336 start_codon:yes stop_codon:yes gene_type:complete